MVRGQLEGFLQRGWRIGIDAAQDLDHSVHQRVVARLDAPRLAEPPSSVDRQLAPGD